MVFEALALARAEGMPYSVVFTGTMEDYRVPDYVPRLLSMENFGMSQDCFFLGLIPKLDQIGIMKSATAVLQPTLFEGGPGGGSVYDAISIGCPVIVSDIPINREIEKFVDAFFPPSDAASLLRSMRMVEGSHKLRKSATVLLPRGPSTATSMWQGSQKCLRSRHEQFA